MQLHLNAPTTRTRPPQCFAGGDIGRLERAETAAARAFDEAAWLRAALEREQKARATAEAALSSERLRCALLEREVLAAAQVGSAWGAC
jgi:hypothetical protein